LIYVPPNDPSPNLQAALAYIDARNNWFSSADCVSAVERMMSMFDEDLEHRILPRSLERPVLNKSQYKVYVNELLRFIREYTISLHEVTETIDNSIIIHASSVGTGLSGAKFSNEYMIFLHMKPSDNPEELPKISKVKEFVDSKHTVEFFREERRRVGAAVGAQS